MVQIRVKKLGAEFGELILTEGEVYFVGRSKDCDLRLDADKGISRKHLRIFEKNGIWIVESLSRLGNLFLNGSEVTQIELNQNLQFDVENYTFSFIQERSHSTHKKETPANESTTAQTHQNQFSNIPIAIGSTDETIQIGSRSTHQQPNLHAFLKISGLEKGNDSILELEGSLWVGGRDPHCEVHIDDGHASRKHFEITRKDNEFFITDLSSANGTHLNGNRLKPHKPIKILSGDIISIEQIIIFFEVRDLSFESKFENAKKQLQVISSQSAPMQYPHPIMLLPPSQNHPHASVIIEGPETSESEFHWRRPETYRNFDYKKHKVHIILAALIPILFIGIFSENKSPQPMEKKESASTSKTFDSLSNDQKAAVKDIFNLAQQHYHSVRYELCITELKKLHNIIPSYENSKKLAELCEQGTILLRQEKDREAREKKKAETEQKIITTVEYCKTQLSEKTTLENAKECLGEAYELDPEHSSILAYLDEIRLRDQLKEEKAQQILKLKNLMSRGRAQFAKAKSLEEKDELSKSIEAYRQFLSANYPGLKNEHESAKRSLASVQGKLNEKIKTLLEECQALRSNGKFKMAWQSCDKATREDPKNLDAKKAKDEALSDLRKEMKSVYQDSILEESLGNVDAAKEKWRLIRKNDLEFEDYYKKATRKLQKYGEGI
ncbi:MAG: FHA domain-containing protein [Bdellovibrionales bacterium]|nr:FHA domain-containing protein [Bdellovibrionales bacterium]